MSEIQLLLYKYFLGSLTWVSCSQVRFDAVRCGSVVRSGVVPWCGQMWPDGAVSYGRCGQVWLRGAVSCGQVRSVTVGCGQVCLRGAVRCGSVVRSVTVGCDQVWLHGTSVTVGCGLVRSDADRCVSVVWSGVAPRCSQLR